MTFDLISKIWKTSFLLSIIGIIILIGVYVFVNNITFKLKGSNNIELELNETYSDEGFIAQVFKWDISNKVKTDNNLNNSRIEKIYMPTKNDIILIFHCNREKYHARYQ